MPPLPSWRGTPLSPTATIATSGSPVTEEEIHAMLAEGVALAPGAYEALFVGLGHTDDPNSVMYPYYRFGAVLSDDDIAGLKLRVIPNPINVDWVKALGANPTPLPFPEVYSALEQKAIDGQENPETVIAANKFYEVQKHIVISNHQYNPQSVLISKKFWDGLTAEQQKWVAQSALEAAKYQRAQARGAVASAVDTLKKNGMQVTAFSPVELAKLRDKLRPVTAKYGVTVGQDLVKELQSDLEKSRSSGKKK